MAIPQKTSLSAGDVLNAPLLIHPDRDTLRLAESNELIFRENSQRWVLFPVQFPTLYEYYKRCQANFWTPESLPWQADETLFKNDFKQSLLTLIHRIALHVCLLSGIPTDRNSERRRQMMKVDPMLFRDVLDLTCEFTEHVQSPEARAFLGFQNMFENFHREAASRMSDTIGAHFAAVNQPLTATYESEQSVAELRLKMAYFYRHCEGFIDEAKIKKLAGDSEDFRAFEGKHSLNAAPLVEVMAALVCLKGLFFIGPIALMRHLCEEMYGSNLAIAKACELMTRDLVLQADFLVHIYANLENKLGQQCYIEVVRNAMELEYNYLCTLLQESNLPDQHSAAAAEVMGTMLRSLGVRFVREAYPHEQLDSGSEHEFFGLPCPLPAATGKNSVVLTLPELVRFGKDSRFHVPPTAAANVKLGKTPNVPAQPLTTTTGGAAAFGDDQQQDASIFGDDF